MQLLLPVHIVAGGMAIVQDADTLAFLAEHGKTARSVTSVCSGALILGTQSVEDFVPDLTLAAPGRVEKAARIGQKERAVEGIVAVVCPGWRHETIATIAQAMPSTAKITSA